ncbi:hypothetical protein [Comamonas sp.]|uniref:hypothetical protein n=1 Tax=Comamonas sp. TaxID=34028 RepID=UPI0028A222BE|nr:hypothetical protein [Comamonas sp.]
MRKNAIHTAWMLAALLAVFYFSDPGTDLAVEQATAADVQDAVHAAQQVALSTKKGTDQ